MHSFALIYVYIFINISYFIIRKPRQQTPTVKKNQKKISQPPSSSTTVAAITEK